MPHTISCEGLGPGQIWISWSQKESSGHIHLSIIQNNFIGADLDKSEAVLVGSITHWKIIESP